MDGSPELLFSLVLLGMLLMLPGLILFGISNHRLSVSARWKWLPVLTGLMGFTDFFLFSGEEISATFLAFRTLFALALLGMGLGLWLENNQTNLLQLGIFGAKGRKPTIRLSQIAVKASLLCKLVVD